MSAGGSLRSPGVTLVNYKGDSISKYVCPNGIQSKSGYFDTGFFCPIGLFCRQVSVKIVLFIIQL